MVVELLGQLDTYFYAIALLVVWNFIWTMKLRNKVFGDGADPTEDGLANDVEELKDELKGVRDD